MWNYWSTTVRRLCQEFGSFCSFAFNFGFQSFSTKHDHVSWHKNRSQFLPKGHKALWTIHDYCATDYLECASVSRQKAGLCWVDTWSMTNLISQHSGRCSYASNPSALYGGSKYEISMRHNRSRIVALQENWTCWTQFCTRRQSWLKRTLVEETKKLRIMYSFKYSSYGGRSGFALAGRR